FATHACILTRIQSTTRSHHGFTSYTTLPYPTNPNRLDVTVSAVCLRPATLSAQNHLTSGLLRTLSRMAASKPTSWLSQQLHILVHLARSYGPQSMIPAVSLSTMKPIPHRLAANLHLSAFGVRQTSVTLQAPSLNQ